MHNYTGVTKAMKSPNRLSLSTGYSFGSLAKRNCTMEQLIEGKKKSYSVHLVLIPISHLTPMQS